MLAFSFAFAESSIRIATGKDRSTFLAFFIEYIAYFVAGYFLCHRCKLQIRSLGYFFVYIISGLSIALGVGLLYPRIASVSWDLLYNYNNPLVVLMSICIFMLSLKIDCIPSSFIPFLKTSSSLSLGVYLMHPFWLIFLNKIGISAVLGGAVIGILLQSVSAFVLSLGSSYAISRTSYIKCIVSA